MVSDQPTAARRRVPIYEQFLKKVAEQVIKPVQKGVAADSPKQLDTPGKRALYNNLTLPTESGATTMNDGKPATRTIRSMMPRETPRPCWRCGMGWD